MAVARALETASTWRSRPAPASARAWPTSCPAILYAVAQQEEGGRLHAHHQPAGAAHGEGSAHARADPAGEVQLHHAQRPGQLPLHPPPAQGHAAGRQPLHLLRGRGAAAHPRMVQDHHRRQPVGLRRRAGPEGLGAGLFRARPVLAQALRPPVRFRQGPRHLLLPARAQSHPLLGRAGVEPHAVLHAARRPGGGESRAASCSATTSSSSTRRTRWSTSPPGTSG